MHMVLLYPMTPVNMLINLFNHHHFHQSQCMDGTQRHGGSGIHQSTSGEGIY